MLSKSKEAYLRQCRSRIDAAETFRKREGLDDLWNRLRDLYRGKHFPEGIGAEDRIAINIAFSTINVIGPSIAINHPKVTVMARRPEEDDPAAIVEALVNYWWRTFEIRPEFRRAVKDMLIFGFGWLKTGYRFVEEEEPVDGDELESSYEQAVAEADDFAEENPELAGDLPTDEEIRASLPYTKMRVVEDRPFVERVSVHDVFVDPEATSMNDMRWIAQRCIKDLDEVRSNPNYKAAGRKKAQSDLVTDERYRGTISERDVDAKKVTVWEFYDLRKGTMCVFSEKGDDFLVEPVDQPYVFGHPFVMLRNYEVPDQFYPMGELEAIEDLQGELNKTRSQQMNHRKRFARKYLYDPRAFGKNAVSALESERDGQFVPVNEGIPLNEAIVPVPQVPLDAQIYAESEQIEADIDLVAGVSEYMRGGQTELRRTATEASIIQDAANARAADKLALVEAAVAVVARRLVQLAQQYTSDEQVARVVGRDGAAHWFAWERWMIQGEFDFEVEGGSTQPQNEMVRRQTALQMLQAVAPFADPQLGLVNLPELLRHVFQFGFGIKDPSKFLGPGAMGGMVDPMTGQPLGMPEEEAAAMQPPPEEEPLDPDDPVNAFLPQLAGQVGLNLGGGS